MFKRRLHIFGGQERVSDNICDQILRLEDKYPIEEGVVGFGDKGAKTESVRRSKVRWIPPQEQMVANLIMHYVSFANRDSFGLDASWLYEIQLSTYHAEEEAYYDWHQDCFFEAATPYQRKLSFIMQLSDPADYEGGEVMFTRQYAGGKWDETRAETIKPRGTVIVFPSFYTHMVKPITKGVRKSLVAWVEGPHWK